LKKAEELHLPENRISKVIVDAAIEVHLELGGPGLLESVYEEALAFELSRRGLKVQRQIAVPILYKGRRLSSDLRLDLLVENPVVVECKAVAEYNSVFDAQALTYLRLLDLRLAQVVNFGAKTIVRGLHRVVNNL
jgi:GxxExxY protein